LKHDLQYLLDMRAIEVVLYTYCRGVDHLSKRDGIWALDERTVVLDWHKVETWPESHAAVPLEGFERGKRTDRTDAVYQMMGAAQHRPLVRQATFETVPGQTSESHDAYNTADQGENW
jgi:hypothetical protein